MIRRSFPVRMLAVFTIVIAFSSFAGAGPEPKKNKKKQHVDALAAQSLMRQAYAFMQQQRYDEALERFAEALKENPGNATVYNMMGLCYLSKGDLATALTNFDIALDLIPGFTDARNNRGSAYLSLKRYGMAEVDFIAVLSDSTYPHRWKVYYNLGITYLGGGQIGAAEDNFRKAIHSATPVFEAYLRLAEIAQSQGRMESALDLLEEAHLKYPDRLDGILAYGRLLIDAGRPSEARPYLQDVIASDPSSPLAGEARILLGQT